MYVKGTLRINGTGKDDDDFTLKGSIYNEGTVTINGDDFYMQNKEAELVNYGIIYIEADFELSAGNSIMEKVDSVYLMKHR